MSRTRQLISMAAVLCLAAGPAAISAAASDAPDAPHLVAADGPHVVAADGAERAIDAIDPGGRGDGVMALYTPDFGPSTRTNAWGAEAVLEPSGGGGQFLVTGVCTVWGQQDGQCGGPGDNAIPEGGYVLSASPGGDDPRTFIRDHVAVGDVVTVDLPIEREVVTTLDVTDPTAATNPDGVDPSTGECFPGCRGAEQLVRYTPESGASTGTNQFGYEVTVIDGRVVQRGGSDNAIPAGGYVLSGHGTRGNWLATHAEVGARVEIDGPQLRIIVDAGSYVFGAQLAIDRAEESLGVAREACLAVDTAAAEHELSDADDALAAALDAVDTGDQQGAVDLAGQALASADRAWYATRASRPLETRGIWVRPQEENADAIRGALDEIADAGFTTVYLETFYQGYTIFPSATAEKYGVTPQRPQFADFDPLAVWVDEAHARDLELHAWVHSFFVGSEATGGPGPILDVYPEWAGVERRHVGAGEPRPSTAEAGYYFVDPAIPGARSYLHDVFGEIVDGYDVDGLHLDYIRYPISLPLESSFSYSDHSRAQFDAEFGVDPLELDLDSDGWEDWTAWRQRQVTSFVTETHARVRAAERDVVLSAAVFPDRFDAEQRKAQNWAGWSEQGIIDVLAGMSFGGSPRQTAVDTETMLEATSASTLIVTGTYAPYSSLPPETMIEQIEAARSAGAHGVALFAYNQLTIRQAAAAAQASFRDRSSSAGRNPVDAATVGVADLAERVSGVHARCITGSSERALRARLNEVIDSLSQPDGDGTGLRRAEAGLRRLADWAPERTGAAPLSHQLREELGRAADVVAYARLRR
ncbi:family 10 glycosylhydrolase [Phytoactinopolyspora alkaliphila]|uniref:Family 10 glycosylhydrolase n=1 Tax=Phytoactinopolyspora alkaliphila TaxID=1783498 RepID=A0A6N9YIW7_9ACTN|nr:family 10 glycosylhydrolase [Phytoactinopolyspora alkaliphila]NED94904.1 family 10 glycosylhydrolase [Phytoactinopolyspora alkaliphila]